MELDERNEYVMFPGKPLEFVAGRFYYLDRDWSNTPPVTIVIPASEFFFFCSDYVEVTDVVHMDSSWLNCARRVATTGLTTIWRDTKSTYVQDSRDGGDIHQIMYSLMMMVE